MTVSWIDQERPEVLGAAGALPAMGSTQSMALFDDQPFIDPVLARLNLDRDGVAHHEAGHAVTAGALGAWVTEIEFGVISTAVRPEQRCDRRRYEAGWRGCVTHWPVPCSETGLDAFVECAAIAVAGPLAQRRYRHGGFTPVRRPSRRDLRVHCGGGVDIPNVETMAADRGVRNWYPKVIDRALEIVHAADYWQLIEHLAHDLVEGRPWRSSEAGQQFRW